MSILRTSIIILFISFLLASCGGGGGGSTSTPNDDAGGDNTGSSDTDNGDTENPSDDDSGSSDNPDPIDDGETGEPTDTVGSVSNAKAVAHDKSVVVSWDSADNATSYDICQADEEIIDPVNCSAFANAVLHANSTSPATINSLINDNEYHFTITPYNGAEAGGSSDDITATPKGADPISSNDDQLGFIVRADSGYRSPLQFPAGSMIAVFEDRENTDIFNYLKQNDIDYGSVLNTNDSGLLESLRVNVVKGSAGYISELYEVLETFDGSTYPKEDYRVIEAINFDLLSDEEKGLSIYDEVVADFASYESDLINVKAPDIAENGFVIPMTVEFPAEIGSLWIYVDGNPHTITAKTAFFNADSSGSLSIRYKAYQTSDVIAVFVDEDGQVIATKKNVRVTISGINPENFTFGGYADSTPYACEHFYPKEDETCSSLTGDEPLADNIMTSRAKPEDRTLKILLRATMEPTDYISSISVYSDGDLVSTTSFSPYIAKNPYLSVLYPVPPDDVVMEVKANNNRSIKFSSIDDSVVTE